jgi:6-phosphofructo-2-kinase/fructose-2,6-biphosphatase
MVTHEQRFEAYDYFSTQLGYRVLFLECICEDDKILDSNCREILRFSIDYKGMNILKAVKDLRKKIEYYKKIHQPMNEIHYPRIRINTTTMEITAYKVTGHVESSVLGYLASVFLKPHTLYFSRVRKHF